MTLGWLDCISFILFISFETSFKFLLHFVFMDVVRNQLDIKVHKMNKFHTG